MRVGLRARWAAMHGVPRAYFAVQARRGDPLARLLRSGTADDRYALMEQIRARGRVVRSPYVWASVDHAVCRQILRDKRFGVTALGAALARIEGATALRALFESFPDLRLTAPPQPRGLINLHGYTRLPAQLGGRRKTSAKLPV